ncbi:LysM peptidoglycan-binding domain-containing protein [Planctomycetota bacterium]
MKQMAKVKIVVTPILMLLMLCIGCGSIPRKAFQEDDVEIVIELGRKIIREKTAEISVDYSQEGGVVEAIPYGPDALVAIPVLLPIIKGIHHAQGTDVYVYPKGHTNYMQQIKWGRNKVFIPSGLAGDDFTLVVTAQGSYSGMFEVTVEKEQGTVTLIDRTDLKAKTHLEYIESVRGRNGAVVYMVQMGDNLRKIAEYFYGDAKYWRKLLGANPLIEYDDLQIGQEIVIPEMPLEKDNSKRKTKAQP